MTTAPAQTVAVPEAGPIADTTPDDRGVLPVWVMSLALGLCVAVILLLLGLIVVQGARTFWPQPIERIELTDGEVVFGVPVRDEIGPDGSQRMLYRVGNRDLGWRPFRWVDRSSIERVSRPEDLVFIEREEWGIFIGRFRGLAESGASRDASAEDAGFERLAGAVDEGRSRVAKMDALRSGPIAGLNDDLGANRQRSTETRLREEFPRDPGLPRPLWLVVLVGAAVSGAIGGGLIVRGRRQPLAAVLLLVAGLLALGVWLEHPAAVEDVRAERTSATLDRLEEERDGLLEDFNSRAADLAALVEDDAERRVWFEASDGSFAPLSQSQADEPMRVSQIVRAIQPNGMSFTQKLAVYFARWGEFLTHDPREANTEGGVFPVIIGTMVVTLLLTIAVVPLGVMAALYIREYATQGVVISVLRIAINNLAGVPSIVYGVFGLGFFCYTVGGFIDTGPTPGITLPKPGWWVVAILAASCAAAGVLLASMKRSGVVGVCWLLAAVAVGALLITSPYFEGFFWVKSLDGEPTFRSGGLLWASLTLALLTLPVVIVSTEEAIAAVPPSLREGSYGCGATRWQTIRRVVLPSVLPGIMTGTILAIARGAGEVAPLMVVGAVKLAPELPVDGQFPYVYADRSFMHLGFHIFDLGFQSPDSEAARGMVWTTTLLLIVLVVAMNLGAILLRNRFRKKLGTGHF
ncbi:MAG: ABC transporter permease subunit [Planctomycetota bacterium]